MHSLDRFHSDPTNWKLGVIYFCRADKRIIVPKRIRGLGWTINFARPMAVPFFVLLLAAIWGILGFLGYLGASADVRFAVKIVLAVGVLVLCYYLAHRRPKQDAPESRPPDFGTGEAR